MIGQARNQCDHGPSHASRDDNIEQQVHLNLDRDRPIRRHQSERRIGQLQRQDREVKQNVAQVHAASPEFQILACLGRQQRDDRQRNAANDKIGRQ